MDLSNFPQDELIELYWDFDSLFRVLKDALAADEYVTFEEVRSCISEKLIDMGYTGHIEPDDPPCYYDSPQWAHDNDYPDNINYDLNKDGYWY